MASPTDTTTPETPNARARYRVAYGICSNPADLPKLGALPGEDSLAAICDHCHRFACRAELLDERGWKLGYVDEQGTASLYPVPIDREPR